MVSIVDAEAYRDGNVVVEWRGMSRLANTYTKNPQHPEQLLQHLLIGSLAFVGRQQDWTAIEPRE